MLIRHHTTAVNPVECWGNCVIIWS